MIDVTGGSAHSKLPGPRAPSKNLRPPLLRSSSSRQAEVLLDSTIHGKLAAAFHKRCDNVEDIYTIVSLKDAAGTVTHVLGGYSALGWTNESIHAHVRSISAP